MRAKAVIETDGKGRQKIVITEIPYQTNKSKILENIADLVKNKRVEGISDLRDESDRDGMRIVIEIKKDEIPEVILNSLSSIPSCRPAIPSSCWRSSTSNPCSSTWSNTSIISWAIARRSSAAVRSLNWTRPKSARTSSKV